MNADLAHDPDLGTFEDQTQSALCKRCRQRVASGEWVEGPCRGSAATKTPTSPAVGA